MFVTSCLTSLMVKKWILKFTQHVEEKPVSDVTFLDYSVDDFSSDESESDVEQVGSHFGTDDDDDSVDNDQEAENAEENEPEPEKDVDLLVDNVERQETKRIVLLHLARSAKLVERTFGHAWKHVNQGVQPILLVLLGKGDHLQTEGQEGPVEKSVHQKHLACQLKFTLRYLRHTHILHSPDAFLPLFFG